MNKTLIYSVIVIAAAAAAFLVFSFVAKGIFNQAPIGANSSNKGVSTQVSKPIEIKVKSIAVNTSSKKTAAYKIAFDIHNPNQNTILLDGMHYNISSNNLPVASGDIGTETQLDVIRGQSSFPVIGNSTITLADTGIIHRNNSIDNGTWNKIVGGNATYVIRGFYSSKQTSNFDYSPGANEFKATYP